MTRHPSQKSPHPAFADISPGRVLDAVGDGLAIVDRNMVIRYQNAVLTNLVGESVGTRCYEAYLNRSEKCPDCLVAACFADGKVHISEYVVPVEGREVVFETLASPIYSAEGAIVAAVEISRDITHRKETERKLVRAGNLYNALSLTNKAIMTCCDRDSLFREICHIAVENGKFALAIIALHDQKTDMVQPVAACGSALRYIESVVVSANAGRDIGRGPTAVAIREDRPYICNDFFTDPVTTPWRRAAIDHGICASAAFPLREGGKAIGALKVYSEQKDFFDREIIELLLEMAVNISFALDNFQREEARNKAEETLRYLSTHDALTGLYNRAYFDTEIARMAASRQYPVSIVIADVDGLKYVNDTFGHGEGDRLIIQAARAFLESFRSEDVVARIGGDEFAVILPGTDLQAARGAVRRFLQAVEALAPESDLYRLSISVGSATADDPQQLRKTIQLADTRMYRSKSEKKTRIQQSSPVDERE